LLESKITDEPLRLHITVHLTVHERDVLFIAMSVGKPKVSADRAVREVSWPVCNVNEI